MSEIILPNREAWLQSAVAKLRPIFRGHGYEVPELQVSVGWPSSGGLGTRKRTIGQCWFGETTADKKPQLFISPLLDEVVEPQGVLPTLIHEICHVCAGSDAKHGPKFVKVMKRLGLEGKPTMMNANEELIERLKLMAKELGAFSHSKIIPSPKDPKKQTTRMKKCECEDCGYIARTVQKWLEIGAPICPCNKKPMKIELAGETDSPEEGENE